MAAYEVFCRAPLVDPAFVSLPDGAVHLEGSLEQLMQTALGLVDLSCMSSLDAVLASKLGGYADLPPMPELEMLQPAADPRVFLSAVRAGLMIASANRDKDEMLRVLTAMRSFADALPSLDEGSLLSVGADALRIASELYRRTGQRFLLTLLERLRSQLPDVSGMFHAFPFLKPFIPEKVDPAATDETSQFYRRMERLGNGAVTADALAITAALALYSGSSRDASASKVGLSALQRYHGLPNGAFSADPHLAGRDPSRAVDLIALCAQVEALCDLLAASGDLTIADRLEILTENALRNAIATNGVLNRQSVNRLATDPNGSVATPSAEQTTALLSALTALRRSVWLVKSESELTLMLPYEGCCLARMDGVPVRVNAAFSGADTVSLAFETKQPVEFTLSVRVPGHAENATVSINGKGQNVEAKTLYSVKRTFRTGDVVTLHYPRAPRVEIGYRGGVSVYCGSSLMALPLPDENAAWQYAIDVDTSLTTQEMDGEPCVQVDACDAPEWSSRTGVIPPPPQGLRMGDAYVLTLLPYANTIGRIAAFPQAARKE